MDTFVHNDGGSMRRQVEYITATVAGQLFAVPILRVRDVFVPDRITRVPMAPPEVLGVLNLRGRIVTMIDMRFRLGLSRPAAASNDIALHIDLAAESYGLVVDGVEEVLSLSEARLESNPANLDKLFASVSAGVHRLEDRLMVVLDVDRVLDVAAHRIAA